LNHALTAYGYAEIADSDVSQHIGPPLDNVFRTLTGSASSGLIRDLVAKYRERYAEVGFAENTLYAGIPEVLASLDEQGCVLGVCTSKRSDFAEKILRRFDIRQRFSFVHGGDIGVDKTVQIRDLVLTGTIARASTMIGDRAVDINAAKRNGLGSVGVLWGHGSQTELLEAGADRILERVAELGSLGRLHAT
jgi:phosphoglycolate phosphatase